MINERIALACGIAAVALWSTVATGFKLGLTVMTPVQLLSLGSLISLAFFTLALLTSGRTRSVLSMRPARIAQVAALGLLNPFGYYLVLFEAYDRLPAQIAQPLNYTWAITLALLAVPILGQALSRRTLLGIMVSYVGVSVLIVGGADIEAEGLDPFGVALALGSTLLWSSYWLASVRLKGDALVDLWFGFAVGAPAVTLVCIANDGLPVLDAAALGYGVWVGLIEMGVTFLLWQVALSRTAHVGSMAQLIFLSPFVSLVLIDRVLGEAVQGSSVLALVLIVAGVTITRSSRSATI